jgi:hypothetical protein
MITITQKGNFERVSGYLQRLSRMQVTHILEKYGQQGVEALRAATPVDTGLTSESWYYTIDSRRGYYSIEWHNHNQPNGMPLAVLLQYGHGTGTGGYVQGRDYIMPAMRPIFDQIANEAWREVTQV